MTDQLPPPRYTDAEVDDLPVQAGLDAVLEGLLAEAAPRRRRAWPVAVAAAAAVALVVGVPAYLLRDDDSPTVPVSVAPSTPSSVEEPTETPTTELTIPGSVPSNRDYVAVTRATWDDPPSSFAVLDAPGWSVESVTTDRTGVGVGYHAGGLYFSVDLVAEKWYDGLYRDNTTGETLHDIQVLGRPGVWLSEPSQQQFAFLPVRDGYGLRVDASFTTPEAFLQLLGKLREVDERGFVAAMPAGLVTPGTSYDVEKQMLDGADLPHHLTVSAVTGYNSRYDVANTVIRDLGCAWARQWVQAHQDDDARGQAEVERALRGSDDWPLVADDLRSRDWFHDTLQLMRSGKDAYVLSSAGCDLNKLDLTYDPRTGTLKQALPTLPDTYLNPQDGVR